MRLTRGADQGCYPSSFVLVRTADDGSIVENGIAIYSPGRGYLTVGEHTADLAPTDYR